MRLSLFCHHNYFISLFLVLLVGRFALEGIIGWNCSNLPVRVQIKSLREGRCLCLGTRRLWSGTVYQGHLTCLSARPRKETDTHSRRQVYGIRGENQGKHTLPPEDGGRSITSLFHGLPVITPLCGVGYFSLNSLCSSSVCPGAGWTYVGFFFNVREAR